MAISLVSIYTQNFDALSSTAGSLTNDLSAAIGWSMTEGGNGARDNELYAVDSGGSGTGDTYSYGGAGSSERALGMLLSGTLIPTIGAAFTNDSGGTITSLAVTYTGEQWRVGTVGRADRIDFQYSLDATSLTSGTWVDVNSLDFNAPTNTGTVGALNGNAAANRATISDTIAGLAVPAGATFWIRWSDFNATGADDGLAVDDFSIAVGGAPATPLVGITAADASAAEPADGGRRRPLRRQPHRRDHGRADRQLHAGRQRVER